MSEMQTSELVENISSFLGQHERQFAELNENCINPLDFAKECEFAKQQLMKNDYTLSAARSNPDSLQSAIFNVAAIGISLNPASAYAYLVPRKVNKQPSICLDVSYRGLIKLATDTGVVTAMKAELVYQNDKFDYKGFHEKPDFSAQPFGDRGELIGVYAMAMLVDGGVLVETMTIDEINTIRDDSEAYKAALKEGMSSWQYTTNVWVKFYTEMVKKTVIKRASKTLPPSRGKEIMDKAIEVINEHEGIEFKGAAMLTYTEEERAEYQRCVDSRDFIDLVCLKKTLSAEAQLQLHDHCVPQAPQGQKQKQAKAFNDAITDAEMELEAMTVMINERINDGDDEGVYEIVSECSQYTIDYILSKMDSESTILINSLLLESDAA